jgi:anti-sigma-K factor RskA
MATVLLGRTALADAAPVQLILLYMPNVSNTGTSAASGIAELVMSEGEVRVKTADLPRLSDGKQYVVWAVNSQTNEFSRLGAFNTAESTGAVDYENVLPDAIPNKHWDLLLVTIEDGPAAAKPSNRHSIAGVFPSPDNAPLPIALPNTGGGPDADYSPVTSRADWLAPLGLAALVSTVTFGAGYALGLKKR